MSQAGQFKEDLYQRLNVIPIQIPPLRERTEDIPLLVEHFLQKKCIPQRPLTLTPEALEVLMAYDWPGNIRELENTLVYIATLFDGETIEVADLPPKLRESIRKKAKEKLPASIELEAHKPFYQRVEEFEKVLLTREFEGHQGSLSKLAVHLGMDRSHLYTKMKEFGIRANKAVQSVNQA
jgi:two-component system nitrogen regulation response regulator NtrX